MPADYTLFMIYCLIKLYLYNILFFYKKNKIILSGLSCIYLRFKKIYNVQLQ